MVLRDAVVEQHADGHERRGASADLFGGRTGQCGRCGRKEWVYLGIDEEDISVLGEMSLTDAHGELQMQEEGLARCGFRLNEH